MHTMSYMRVTFVLWWAGCRPLWLNRYRAAPATHEEAEQEQACAHAQAHAQALLRPVSPTATDSGRA